MWGFSINIILNDKIKIKKKKIRKKNEKIKKKNTIQVNSII